MNKKALNIKVIPFHDYKEYHITINQDSIDRASLELFMGNFREKKIHVISITYAGSLGLLKKISDLFIDFPLVAIGEDPEKASRMRYGIYIYAVQGGKVRTEYIRNGSEIIGAYSLLSSDRKGLFLKTPLNLPNKKASEFKKEAMDAYGVIDKETKKYKFSFKNIHRFWNYMEDIGTNYASFNKARNFYFKKYGVVDYPAATGIEAILPGEQEINVSIEALKTKNKKFKTIGGIKSDLQCEACVYGPKFSRAKLIIFKKDEVQKIFISGTSNVNLEGGSIYTDDYEKNINYVISCIKHLLNKAQMSLGDIVMSRVYSKNLAIEKIFEKLYSEKKWNFPNNKIIANICRDSFIFEIECVASKKFGKAERIREKFIV